MAKSKKLIEEFNERGQIIHHKDSKGPEKWFIYDDIGRLLKIKYSDGLFKEYEYDEHDNVIHRLDSDGREIFAEYDKYNRLIYRKTLPENSIERWKFYSNGTLYWYKDKAGVEKWYKPDGRLTLLRVNNSMSTYGYIGKRKLIYLGWGNGESKYFTYNNRCKLIHTKETTGLERWYYYNGQRLDCVKNRDANGRIWYDEYSDIKEYIFDRDSYDDYDDAFTDRTRLVNRITNDE